MICDLYMYLYVVDYFLVVKFSFILLNVYFNIVRDKVNMLFNRIFFVVFYCYFLYWYVSFDVNDK